MSAEIIDFTKPLEERQFEAKEDRLIKMKAAFKMARLEAATIRTKNKSPKSCKASAARKKKNPPLGK